MDWLNEMMFKKVDIVMEGPRPLVTFHGAQLLEVCSIGVVFYFSKRYQFVPWHAIHGIEVSDKATPTFVTAEISAVTAP